MVKYYLVGGAVRDKIMGVPCKDLDYCCVAPSYAAMKESIEGRGGQIFLESPQYLTIRAKVPNLGISDFVLARKEGDYDGRYPNKVEPGTLLDDLGRRDFTINAIAMDESGEYIDPFGGIADIDKKYIRCVGNTKERIEEDYLRMLRGLRFAITKGFDLDDEIKSYLKNHRMVDKLFLTVSSERIREEMVKCFKYNSYLTLRYLEYFNLVQHGLFTRTGLWLKPTFES